ncbi:MAG: hypothetical protein ACI8TP_003491 [Acidimicrobiales bacterium]|jgi:hypothetical protein
MSLSSSDPKAFSSARPILGSSVIESHQTGALATTCDVLKAPGAQRYRVSSAIRDCHFDRLP